VLRWSLGIKLLENFISFKSGRPDLKLKLLVMIGRSHEIPFRKFPVAQPVVKPSSRIDNRIVSDQRF
jgi:hypothetical protein